MWIFLNDSFLSIVVDRDNNSNLLVRARVKGDIERMFPKIKTTHLATADYAYRASIPREIVTKAIADKIKTITYENFKDSVKEHDRHDVYFDVWAVMRGIQEE